MMVDGLKESFNIPQQRVTLSALLTLSALSALPLNPLTMNLIHGSIFIY